MLVATQDIKGGGNLEGGYPASAATTLMGVWRSHRFAQSSRRKTTKRMSLRLTDRQTEAVLRVLNRDLGQHAEHTGCCVICSYRDDLEPLRLKLRHCFDHRERRRRRLRGIVHRVRTWLSEPRRPPLYK